MGFSLFGSSGSGPKTTTTTNVTDASATAAEGSLAASGGSSITVNSVDPEVTRQAFGFGGQALASNVAVSGAALDTGLESLRISANLVPDLLKSQSEHNAAALRAASQNVNLAEQFASQGAALARGAQTGGAATLLEGPVPYVVGAVILGALFIIFRKKG